MREKVVVWHRHIPQYEDRMKRIGEAVKRWLEPDLVDAGSIMREELAEYKAQTKATPKHDKFWEITLWPDTQGGL
jgi:hypothetical protein